MHNVNPWSKILLLPKMVSQSLWNDDNSADFDLVEETESGFLV